MLKHLVRAGAAATVAAFAFTSIPAHAADLPCRTAKLIVPWGAGGGTDVIFRIFVESINKTGIKPQLQVVNIGGQGGNKGAKEARKAKANGCTLFAIHQSALTSYLNGRVDFTWDAFEPVAMLTRTPAIVGANPSVPYNNMQELIAAAKAKPKQILTGGTLGSTSHFVFLLIEDAAGIELKHVSYDGTRQRMTALLAKNIELGEINLAAAKKYIQTKELKALGITTADRDAQAPYIPTLKEQGINLVYGTDRGVSAPKGTPKAVVEFWSAALQKAATDPAVVKALNAKGTSVNYQNPAQATKYWSDTFAKWKALAKKVGMYKGS